MTKGILINYDYCTGCHSCEVACKKELGLPEGEFGVKLSETGPDVYKRQVVVMFFILVSTTLSTKSYYPGEDAPSAPAGAVRVGVMGQAVPDREQAPAIDKKQCFQQRCDAVALSLIHI